MAITSITVITASPAQAMTNGQPVTDPLTAPWVATLAFKGTAGLLQRAGCGAALFAPDRVLFAAHCVDGADPSQLEVHVNARVLSTDPGEVRDVRGISVLPGYQILPSPAAPGDVNASSARNDLALALLDRPVTDIVPIPLATHRPAPGTAVTVFAHGTTGKAGPDFRNDVLHRGDLTMISHQDCQAATPATVDAQSVACAQDETGGGVTMCFQDSGSPVVQFDGVAGDRPVLVGVDSFGGETAGKSCGQPAAEAFTDVTAFRAWSYQPFPALEPYPATPATVSGIPAVGQAVRCVPPRWSWWRGQPPSSVEYGWATVLTEGPFQVPQPIQGATAATLILTPTLAGQRVACTVMARNAGGTSEVLSAAVTVTR